MFDKESLKREYGLQVNKDFHKVCDNLKFTNLIRKSFLNISKQQIRLSNPLMSSKLAELQIDVNELIKEIKQLRSFSKN